MSQLESNEVSKLNMNELKKILRDNNLPVSGNKPLLIKRVKDLVSPQAPLQMMRPVEHNTDNWVPTSDRGYMNFIKEDFGKYKLKGLDQSSDPCERKQKITLFDHQKFLKKYFTKLSQVDSRETNRGIFLYHSVGSGKTKSAVIMAENARSYNVNGVLRLRKVIGLIPASLRNSPWLQEVMRIHPKNNSEVLLARIGYFFLHYNNTTSFKSQLMSLIDTNSGSKNPFDNSIVIVDEVHNILNSLPSADDSVRMQIYNWMMSSNNTKFIMLSGTPIQNTPYELAYAINVLRGEEVFPVKNEDSRDRFMNKFFRDDKMINKQLLKRNIQGLFSYFIGADPRAFAKKVFHNVQVPMDSYQWGVQSSVYQREQDIAKGIDRTNVGVSRSDIESQIKTIKRANALKASGSLKSALAIKAGNYGGSDTGGSFKSYSRSNSNFAYPKKVLSKYGQDKFPEIISQKHFNAAVKEIDLVNELPMLSQKISKMIETVRKSKGPLIIFSNFEGAYGIRLVAKVLEAHGMSALDTSKDTLSGISKKERYTIWSGATDAEARKNILKVFNSDQNKTGEYVRVICITTAGKEGISLRGIRQIHILEPWWNMNIPLQVIGRGVRICSHAHLPPADRVVDIYSYLSVPPKGVEYIYPAVDISIMKNALHKQRKDKEFLQLLKESSLDCYINQAQSNVSSCANFSNYKNERVYTRNVAESDNDFEDDNRVKLVEYRGKKYLLRGNLVFGYLSQDEINSGKIHTNIGIADINMSGDINSISFTDDSAFTTVELNGKKFLSKNNKLFQYLSPQDLRNGLKPVQLN
jgi:hypothetical protein